MNTDLCNIGNCLGDWFFASSQDRLLHGASPFQNLRDVLNLKMTYVGHFSPATLIGPH